MPVYSLNVFDLDHISTSATGFDDNGGYHFALGVDTVTIAPDATSQAVSVLDTADSSFDDDASTGQTLAGDYTIGGGFFPTGTIIESEYHLLVEDSLGNSYTLQVVTLNEDAFTAYGFVVQGAMPPWNEPLTVVAAYDYGQGVNAYATSTPACFEARTRILTDRGEVEAARLRPGDSLVQALGGVAAVGLVIASRVTPTDRPGLAPVRISAGALGEGRPARDLTVSRQHRIYLPLAGVLVPAHALLDLAGVAVVEGLGHVDYVHLVTARHTVILAEMLPCETFWPGQVAMSGLTAEALDSVRAIMGRAPVPAAPLVNAGYYRRVVAKAPVARELLAPG
ncbi:Hint domain-containing protein [Albibacillus kandeliae]|uniref:Hint domain-containing protein n=1 Tax=Albibacillus kandeliae TaxID=2174228 RepID=UPI000D69C2A2|nr:Hint domain-containing protein [Albibacillus kandeliae]